MEIEKRERYISPFTDFGFKKIFGEEPNKDLLLDFLNELLKEEQGEIVDLTYIKNERLSLTEIERKAIFDLHCKNEKGEKFIVEIQKTKHDYFKDRTVYYSTFPIREQAKKGEWNYELKSVYMIAILDFVFDDNKKDVNKYRYDVKLTDIETQNIFYDKLTFIYLEMPKFNKSVKELETRFDKWLYILKNLNRLERMPEELSEKVFEKLFETAEISKFTVEQVEAYEDSLKSYRDFIASLETKYNEGIKEGIEIGREEERIEMAKNMLTKKMEIDIISEVTGLTEQEIKSL
jgi:predicted transposase/invertase (TIGR01784 family)